MADVMSSRVEDDEGVFGTPIIRVLTIDDHDLLREGVNAVVSSQGDMEVVGEAENGLEGIEAYRRLLPDIVLLDLQMPVLDGLSALSRLRGEFPDAMVIVLTTFSGDAQAVQALRMGAAGYLLKSSVRTELLDAIRSVYKGGKHLNASVAREIALHVDSDGLSAREREVLSIAALGNSNKQIAARLSLSEDTIKGYMKAIFAKLGASDRTHAVMIATRRGIITV